MTDAAPLPPARALSEAAVQAATQQGVAFAVWTLIETAQSLQDKSITTDLPDARPAITTQAIGTTGVVAGIVLLHVPALALPGCLAGLVASGFLMSNAVKRVQNVTGGPMEFPGPKVWPAGAALIDFFQLCVFFQAAQGALSG